MNLSVCVYSEEVQGERIGRNTKIEGETKKSQ